jgi:hypothetical protein
VISLTTRSAPSLLEASLTDDRGPFGGESARDRGTDLLPRSRDEGDLPGEAIRGGTCELDNSLSEQEWLHELICNVRYALGSGGTRVTEICSVR